MIVRIVPIAFKVGPLLLWSSGSPGSDY